MPCMRGFDGKLDANEEEEIGTCSIEVPHYDEGQRRIGDLCGWDGGGGDRAELSALQ